VESLHSELIPDPVTPEEEPKSNWRRALVDMLETITLSLALFLIINAVSERIRVESISMEPNLIPGDFVIVNKLAYELGGSPDRGDVIVFRYPPNPEQIPYIKRIIGLPGDNIHIAAGSVYVNGELLVESYIKIPTNRGGDWTVPDNSLFVMGDNRNNSSDSRAWGYVPFDNIIGRAEVIYWPPEEWGLLNMPTAVAAPEQ
jgi:signal peptidase I